MMRTGNRSLGNRPQSPKKPDDIQAEEDLGLIDEIRGSIRNAIIQVPWKFNIWKSALRIAARRPIIGRKLGKRGDNGYKWLGQLLRLIKVNGVWQKDWPEKTQFRQECFAEKTQNRVRTRSLYLSFIRAAVWSYLAEMIKDINSIIESADAEHLATDPRKSYGPTSWLYKCFNMSSLRAAVKELAKLDRWARILYGRAPSSGVLSALCQEEIAGLAEAVLACTKWKEISQMLIGKGKDIKVTSILLIDELTNQRTRFPLTMRVLASKAKDSPFNRVSPLVALFLSGRGRNNARQNLMKQMSVLLRDNLDALLSGAVVFLPLMHCHESY
jgi:hypothetical protein